MYINAYLCVCMFVNDVLKISSGKRVDERRGKLMQKEK